MVKLKALCGVRPGVKNLRVSSVSHWTSWSDTVALKVPRKDKREHFVVSVHRKIVQKCRGHARCLHAHECRAHIWLWSASGPKYNIVVSPSALTHTVQPRMLLLLSKYAASLRNLAHPTAKHTELSFKRQRCGTKEHDTQGRTQQQWLTIFRYIFFVLSKFDLSSETKSSTMPATAFTSQ